MGEELKDLEGCIQIHIEKMLGGSNGSKRKTAACQVAIHTTKWLKIIRDPNHPRWGEMSGYLEIAMKIVNPKSDDDGDFLGDGPTPPPPLNPRGGLQAEWCDMISDNLRVILELELAFAQGRTHDSSRKIHGDLIVREGAAA